MSECPYDETIIDEYSDTEIINGKYVAWHEGYEAHKSEIAGYVTDLKNQLEDEIKKAKQLQIDLIVRYYENMLELSAKEKTQETE